ncbi:uncharacterized protein RAG0_16825 [Rhynchosporium agropyri]|uniref:Uncharacterized protein n=1 Tax=Rhynchosporium agropyri TaxID=914238 RepID=A0A1E1LTU5_9HELO|nr:uncharacterized protein RAG0_16825 [Rhynchosporium agropyri]
MKPFAIFLLLASAVNATGETNPVGKRLCWLEKGIACYYDGGYCYWHKCKECTCDDTRSNHDPPKNTVQKNIRRDCTHFDAVKDKCQWTNGPPG